MPENHSLLVEGQNIGQRLDKYLSELFPTKTRSSIQKLIEQNLVICNEKPLNKKYKLKGNEWLSITFPDPTPLDVQAEDISLDIVYEDADLLVVNKPKDMVVHPAAGNHEGTLVNALLYHCQESLSGINGVIRPGIVHRIDKDTSGLLIVAKNDNAHVKLAEQIKKHSFSRTYEAIVYGRLPDDEGIIDKPIGRHEKDRKKMCVTDKNAKNAITHFKVITKYEQFTHVQLRLETGRTHQIRVHMASIGHPVAGDCLYGPKKCITELGGQCLHAKSIGFVHPTTDATMDFTSELPLYFKKFLLKLKHTRI